MVPQDKIIEIFCSVDDFCSAFETEMKNIDSVIEQIKEIEPLQ
jgi:hypothetical protein